MNNTVKTMEKEINTGTQAPEMTATAQAQPQGKKSKRILALDVMRGITIAGMILVNNSGGDGTFTPLSHSDWNGLTPCDLVFPFFMFIMGISTYISLRKFKFEFSWPLIWKICRRTALIFLIGMGLAWMSMFFKGAIVEGKILVEATLCFGDIRILGVLPRLAICYGVGSLLAIWLNHKWLPAAIAAILVAYALMLLIGNGYAPDASSILSRADRALLTDAHMYYTHIGSVKIPIDPEGVLSTLPSIAHVMIGFWCGMLLLGTSDNRERVLKLMLVGTVLTFLGLLFSYGFPINKKVWSPTFVLTTCGMAASTLALLIWVIDIKGWSRWSRFFEVYGVNPLFLYCVAWVIAIFMGLKCFPDAAAKTGFYSLKNLIYYYVTLPTLQVPGIAALVYALTFVLVVWLIGLTLYKRRIYIKI